ncbi:MAG: DUF421 domain-containing protein [Chloroflexi bacterium]|nr:DUF421 domain-containing protein [Chloroflexota bacterium]
MHILPELMGSWLGLEAESLTLGQMALRAMVVYVAALMMVRVGEKRFLGKNTAFDVILGIILGSVVSRGINGSAPFFPTLGAGFVLVGLHWTFAAVSYRWSRFGTLIKGSPRTLVKDGQVLWEQMGKSHLSANDLESALRTNAKMADPAQVAEARLERSGDISILTEEREPRVVEVEVQDGVQTVRIEID